MREQILIESQRRSGGSQGRVAGVEARKGAVALYTVRDQIGEAFMNKQGAKSAPRVTFQEELEAAPNGLAMLLLARNAARLSGRHSASPAQAGGS